MSFMQIVRIGLVLTLGSIIGLHRNHAGGTMVPAYEVHSFDESNKTFGGILSCGTNGMPVVTESLTATTYNGVDTFAGATVKFECNQPSRLVPVSGTWPVTQITDSKGQARVEVKGAGGSGFVTVTSKWLAPGTQNVLAEASLVVDVCDESEGSGNPGVYHSALSPAEAIPYSDQTTYMSTYVQSALSGWASTGRVGFTASSSPKIRFTEVSDPDGDIANCNFVFEGTNLVWVVHFNTPLINGDPWASQDPTDFARIGWRSHPLHTAMHELGHALGLTHSKDESSLMDGGLSGWFDWKREEPTASDLVTFYSLYPE